MDDLRSLILGCMDSLSARINETAAYAYTFAFEPSVRERRDELYVAVLDAIEAIATWIGKTRGCKSCSSSAPRRANSIS